MTFPTTTAGDRQEAIHAALADAATSEGPHRRSALLAAGILTLDAERYVDALATLREALDPGPDAPGPIDPVIHFHVGRALTALGRSPEALTHFHLAGHAFRDDDRLLDLAACLREHARALADLTESDAFDLLNRSLQILDDLDEPRALAATHLVGGHTFLQGGLVEGARIHQRLAAEIAGHPADPDAALLGFRIDVAAHPETLDLAALDHLRTHFALRGRRQSAGQCDLLIARGLAATGLATAALARALHGARILLEQWIDISDFDEVGLWFDHHEADLELPMILAEVVGVPSRVVELFELAADASDRGLIYPHEEQYLTDLAERAGNDDAVLTYDDDTLFGNSRASSVPGTPR